MDRYKEFSAKLKVKVAERYQTFVRKNVLEHKEETIEQIKRINKFEYQFGTVIMSNTVDQDKELKKELEGKGGEGKAALRRVKKLEQKVEKIGEAVYGMLKKYDH